MIFSQLVGVAAVNIDGIITSRVLGSDAYSAICLLSPLISILILLAGFISTGEQIVCSQLIGKGSSKGVNAVFSFTLIIGAVISAVFILACLTMPELMFRVSGVSVNKNPEIYAAMGEYLKGYLIGVPAVMLVQILAPMAVMDSGKRLVSYSSLVLCVADVAGDLMNAYLFHGGVFGMGVATAAATVIQAVMLCAYFVSGKSHFRFVTEKIPLSQVKEICAGGMPTFIRKLATTLRDLIINRINIGVALGTAAIAARGMQNDLNVLMFCIGLGIGKTLITITGVYYGAGDREGLKQLFSEFVRMSVTISLIVGALVFAFAGSIARLYTSDAEVVELAIFSMRCMAVSLVFDTLAVAFQNYLQGICQRKMVNLMNFGERFFIPIITALVLGRFWGSKGIMASVAVGKLLLVVMMFLVLCVRCKGFPKKQDDFMFLPAEFGGSAGENHYASIRSMEDVIRESTAAEEFCKARGADEKISELISLFVEEMAGNIIQHGHKKKKAPDIAVEYRLCVNENGITITLRDCYEAFDPVEYFNRHIGEDGEYGIEVVMKLANQVSYSNAFNSNNLLIHIGPDAKAGKA